MPGSRAGFLCLLLTVMLAAPGLSQVVAPVEIKDPVLRELQNKYLDDLKAVRKEVVAIKTDFPFYLSRKLDVPQPKQGSTDSSIRFDNYQGKTVLAITGNYYASYLESMSPERRAQETYTAIVLPILKAAVPRFQNNPDVQGYALEISHHVRGKVMDLDAERPENLFVFFPRNAALKLLAAKDDTTRQAALLEGQVLLNAEPITLWLSGEAPPPAQEHPPALQDAATKPGVAGAEMQANNRGDSAPVAPVIKSPKNKDATSQPPPRDSSPAALATLQAVNTQTIDALTKELNAQAHLVS